MENLGFFCLSFQLTLSLNSSSSSHLRFVVINPFSIIFPPPSSSRAASDVLPNSVSTKTSVIFHIKSF